MLQRLSPKLPVPRHNALSKKTLEPDAGFTICYNSVMNSIIHPALLNTVKLYRPRLAIVFGSKARGNADPTSDIDLLMVKKTQDNFFDRLKKFALMLPHDTPRVDALIYTPEEFDKMKESRTPLVQQAIKEGRVIYETSD